MKKQYTLSSKYLQIGLIAFILIGTAFALQAQDLNITESFDDCALPIGWTSNIVTGEADWQYGINLNTNSDSSSIDGSCMVFFDDDIIGNQAPFSTVQLLSPTFDGTSNSTVFFELDVHFRNYGGSTLSLYIFDGTDYQLLQSYGDDNATGTQMSQFVHYQKDVSQYGNPANHIMIEFDDNDEYAWWAGFDNFSITGTGNNTNLFFESFDDCALPSDWTSNILTGTNGWQFGTAPGGGNTMDGSCFAFFDDDALGDGAAASKARIISPVFDGTQFANVFLDVDLHYRDYQSENLRIIVTDGTTEQIARTYSGENFAGDNWYDFIHETLDISPYRSQTMQIIFEYDDSNGSWGWWAGIDNFKISGNGTLNDLCVNSETVSVGGACVEASNVNALFEGGAANCVANSDAGIWFDFIAPNSGNVTIQASSDFNDVLTLFGGNCNSLNDMACTNADEFGFTGETLVVSGLNGGQPYYIRVSGADCTFGAKEGTVCLSIIDDGSLSVPPVNDVCSGAIALDIDAVCVAGTNVDATFDGPTPILNNKSRHTIWYSFEAPASGNLTIETGADFADVITVFGGTCGALNEVLGTDFGPTLSVEGLTPTQTYFIQIAGAFATVEGNVCMRLTTPGTPPNNDICTTAIDLTLGESCRASNNDFATFTGPLTDLFIPFENFSSSTVGQPNYTRPHQGGTCELSDVTPRYDVVVINVSTTGSYTITNDYFQFDGYLHIYANSFDPENPCATYLAGNDDLDCGYNCNSQVIVNLQAGIDYYIVTSGYNSGDAGVYETTLEGPGTATQFIEGVQLNGMPTTCDAQPTAAIWFKFVAPSSGTVRINSGADFVHSMSLYAGFCGNLEEVGCYFNPSKCEGAVAFSDLEAGEEYFVQIASGHNPFGYNYGDVCISINDNGTLPVKARIKAFLEGAYNGSNAMTTILNVNNQLPDDQPYNAPPWNHNEVECVTNFPQTMVDWVFVELRDASDATLVVERKAALLLSNGNIIDENNDGVLFNRAVDGQSYYIVVRHRNHLAVMSSVPVPLPNPNHFNFTTSATAAMGGNQLKALGSGVYALYAGDFNSDGVITVADFNYYSTQAATLNDYNDADVNLDRNVTVADFNLYQPNASVIGIEEIRY